MSDIHDMEMRWEYTVNLPDDEFAAEITGLAGDLIPALLEMCAALHAERNAAINQVMGFLHITHDSMISWADAADEIVSALAGRQADVEANAEAVEGWRLLNQVLPELRERMRGTEESLNFCGKHWAVTNREFAHNKAIKGNMIGLGASPLSALQEAAALLRSAVYE